MFGKLREKLKFFLSKKPEKEEKKLDKQEKVKKETKKPSEKPKKKPSKPTKEPQEPPILEPEKIIEQDTLHPLKEPQFTKKTVEPKEPVEQVTPKEEIIEEKPTAQAEPKETPKPSFFSRFKKKLISSRTLTQQHVDKISEPLELILLENNVALEVVDKIKSNLSKDLVGLELKKSDSIEQTISNSLKNSISSALIEPPDLIKAIKSKLTPYTIVFFGINGSGKTTSIAKLAHKLKSNKISCVLAAADTFRAASIEQLEIHASKLKVPIIKSQYGTDPTSVAFDAVQYANKNKIQCVLIDTAGRMYTKENLIKQMEKLIRVIKPDLKLFVGESITGNDATQQARTFNEAIGIDGIILSKADVDEKGGTALSVSQITSKPIYFLGTGQSYSDLEDFKKEKILENLGLD